MCAYAFLAIIKLKFSIASLAKIFQSESVTFKHAIWYALLKEINLQYININYNINLHII